MASKCSNDWADCSEFSPFIESLSGPPQPLSLFSVQCPLSTVFWQLQLHWRTGAAVRIGLVVDWFPKHSPLFVHLVQKVTLEKNSIWVHIAYALTEAETPDFVPRVVPVKHYVFVSGLPFSWSYYNQNKVLGLHWNCFMQGVNQLNKIFN